MGKELPKAEHLLTKSVETGKMQSFESMNNICQNNSLLEVEKTELRLLNQKKKGARRKPIGELQNSPEIGIGRKRQLEVVLIKEHETNKRQKGELIPDVMISIPTVEAA